MKTLSVQIHTESISIHKANKILSSLKSLASNEALVGRIDVAADTDESGYININFDTPNISDLWLAICAVLCLTPGKHFSEIPIIVVSEGEHGWDDYRLLYHFDEKSVLDNISESTVEKNEGLSGRESERKRQSPGWQPNPNNRKK